MKRGGWDPPLISIHGEARTALEWSRDPRCQVAYSTLRKRLWEGQEGPAILLRKGAAGRPRNHDAQ